MPIDQSLFKVTPPINNAPRIKPLPSRANQSMFTELATRSKEFTFIVRDGAKRQPFVCVRNGVSVTCTGELTLFIPPEELTREQPARLTVTQTPHGAWTDTFGIGLPKWSLKGTTGWRARTEGGGIQSAFDQRIDGYTAFHTFTDLIQFYFTKNKERAIESFTAGRPLRPLLELVFHDHADDEWWVIEPDGLPSKQRAATKPLLYEYDFRFTGVRKLTVSTPSRLPDYIGQAIIGSDERDQKSADTFVTNVTEFGDGVAQFRAVANQNPSEAARLDGIAEAVMNRDGALMADESFSEWQDQDIHRVLGTAGTPSAVLASTSTLTKPTFLSRCEQLSSEMKQLGKAVDAWRKGVTSFIATPISRMTSCLTGVRDMMNAVALASNLYVLTAPIRSALRLLRTNLRNIWCSIQSILSFPYNFVQGLKATMQSFLDLFKLSGCATTFPRVKPLSWQGPQMTIPKP